MYLAIDIGGTKTLFARFSDDGKVQQTHKFATPEGYEDFIKKCRQEYHRFITADPIEAVVAAVPGRLDRRRGIAVAFGNRPWENVPIRADLEAVIGQSVRIENDAKLAGLSEARLVPQYQRVLYVTISTGINSALVINGRLDSGTLDSETGQLLLEHEGRLTDWEDFGSGRAFQQKFGKKVSEITDPHAWYYIARNIAVGLIDLMATYTPEAIILGGGVGAHFDKFGDRLQEELKIYQNPMLPTPILLPAQRAEEAVIYGCYQLARDPHELT